MRDNLIRRTKKQFASAINKLRERRFGEASEPLYPSVEGNGLRIHLGSGPINIQGWVNVDARHSTHIHVKATELDLSEFTDGKVSEIYMCHVLEHFSFEEINNILKTMNRKLKVGGVLRISVPDFDQLLAIYSASGKNLELIKRALMGGQDYEYNFHKGIFNRQLLTNLLTNYGFNEIKEWNTREDFGISLGDWSEKGFDTPAGKIPVSLNIKALKAHAL